MKSISNYIKRSTSNNESTAKNPKQCKQSKTKDEQQTNQLEVAEYKQLEVVESDTTKDEILFSEAKGRYK